MYTALGEQAGGFDGNPFAVNSKGDYSDTEVSGVMGPASSFGREYSPT